MDPFSLIAFVIAAAVGGVIGNRADDRFCQVMGTVTDRLRRGGPPVNHDLQRAVRKAYLQATLVVCEACLKALGVAPSVWRRDVRILARPSDEMRWLDAVRRAIHEELRRIPRADYVPPSTETEKQVELMLQPKGTTGKQRKEELCATLKQSVLDELRQRHGEPPARFAEMVQGGWDDSEPDNIETHLDWFDLLCAFFVYDLKTNEKVRTIFEGQLLAQLTVEGTPLTLKVLQSKFEAFGKEMVNRLERLDAYLEKLRSEQAEGFAGVQDRLDEALPLLVCLPDISAKQQTAIEMLQAILEILNPLPLPKPDYAAYLQRLQQRLRELTARECALFRFADFDPLTDALPLHLSERKPDTLLRLPSRDGERGAAEEILAKYPRLVIIADGGAGKTTLARRWACTLAERALTDATTPVPVYVEMNLYQQGRLRELISMSAELDTDTLQAELRAGRFALIFDGLNEVAADAYADAVRELRTLLSYDNSNRVLVTTRKHAYKDDLRLPTFAIEPLRESDITAFVTARLGGGRDAERAGTLARQLLADVRLRSLAENPMMLTMLTAIVGQAGDIPRNRGQLFKAFVDGVFTWEEQSLKAGETRLDRAIKEACLASIAYCLTEQGKVAADKLTVGNWIADKLDELRLRKMDWTNVYGELLRNGLLVESRREVRFFNEVGSQFFCATELLSRSEVIEQCALRRAFVGPLGMAAALSEQPGRIIAQIMGNGEDQNRTFHAAESIWYAGSIDNDTRNAVARVVASHINSPYDTYAIVCLGWTGSVDAVPFIIESVNATFDGNVEYYAAWSLCDIGPPALPAVTALLCDPNEYTRSFGAFALRFMGLREVEQSLIHALGSEKVEHVIGEICLTLEYLGTQAALPALVELISQFPDEYVIKADHAAVAAIRRRLGLPEESKQVASTEGDSR